MNSVVLRKSASGFCLETFDATDFPGPVASIDRDIGEISDQFAKQIEDPIWKLELTKAQSENCLRSWYQWQLALEAIKDSAHGSCLIPNAKKSDLNLFLKRQQSGLHARLRASFTFMAFVTFRFLPALSGALVAWMYYVLRYPGNGSRIERDHPIWIALHDELSNRTLHVLEAVRDADVSCASLILGRQKSGTDGNSLREYFSKHLPNSEIQQPLDLKSAIRTMAVVVIDCFKNSGTIYRCGTPIRVRDLTAIIFRMFLGHASAFWWKKYSPKPKKVYFGHTGVADTSLLELAMQRDGVKTVHVLHGATPGWTFAGVSSEAFFKSGYDADRYNNWFGYEKCSYSSLTAPEFSGVGNHLHLFTNLLHPTNPAFLRYGAGPELHVLNMVKQACELLAIPQRKIFWHPHPQAVAADKESLKSVLDFAEAAGFSIQKKIEALQDIAQNGIIITTPSTVAMDALKVGALPIIVSHQQEEDNPAESSANQFPLTAYSAEKLAEMIRQCRDGMDIEQVYYDTFKKLRPAADFTFHIPETS